MQPTHDIAPTEATGSGAASSLAALMEGWRLITLALATGAALAWLAATILRQRYEATVTVSTISSQRSLPFGVASGLAAQFLNMSGSGGMQATPALVARLTHLQSVLIAVADYQASGDSATIMQRLTGRRGERSPNSAILRKMSRVIGSSWDRESGLVTIRVVHSDSALARVIVERTVAEITRVFRQASRAQANEIRQAQHVRLDSAESQLRHAEQHLVDFLSANRVVAAHSALQAQLQSRQRAVDIAQSVYMQVRTEREAAVGKELEETPAVVVLDSLPVSLPRVSISVWRIVLFGMVMGLVLGAGIILVRERSREELTTNPAGHDRLVQAFKALPLIGSRRERDLPDRLSGT